MVETGNEKQRIREKFRELLSSFDHKTGEAISHGLALVRFLQELIPESQVQLGWYDAGIDAISIDFGNDDLIREEGWVVPLDLVIYSVLQYKPEHVYIDDLFVPENLAVDILKRLGINEEEAKAVVESYRFWYS
ncbi:hypothetical protein phiLo_38 [Thermus phage phiLo]|nr:hypothetical protein phiLo_38 [Thermus phage phiLo]